MIKSYEIFSNQLNKESTPLSAAFQALVFTPLIKF